MGKNRNKGQHHSGGSREGAPAQSAQTESRANIQPQRVEQKKQKSPVEQVIEQIDKNFSQFKRSVEFTINTLLSRDFSKQAEPGAPDANVSLQNASKSIEAINSVLTALKEKNKTDKNAGVQIEELSQLKDRLGEAVDSYIYRLKNGLKSGEKQVDDLITQVAKGTLPESQLDSNGRETNPEVLEQRERFKAKNQPDIADRYAGLVMIDQAIKRVFMEYKLLNFDGTKTASFSDISEFIDELVKLGGPSKWSEEQNQKARLLIEPLQQLFDIPVFGDKAKEKYEALKAALEDESIAQTFKEKGITDNEGRTYDLNFVLKEIDRVAENIDAFTWKQEDVKNFLLIVQALKELSSLPITGENVKQVLEKLKVKIHKTIEAGLKTDQVPALLSQGREIVEKLKIPPSDKEFYDVIAELDSFFSAEAIAESRGWIIFSQEDINDFMRTLIKNKENIVRRLTVRFQLETSQEKETKTKYCKAIEDFVKGYEKSQKQLKLLLPLINELELVNTFGKTQEETIEQPAAA